MFGTNDVRSLPYSLNIGTFNHRCNNEVLFVFRVLKFNLFYEYSFELIEKETERVERVNAKSKH